MTHAQAGTVDRRVIKVAHVETRTKTDKRLWWKEPELGSQADLSLPSGSTTDQEITGNLSLHLPAAKRIVMCSGGELLRS